MAAKAVTDATFVSDVLQSDKPVLVDFWAEWCAPCRKVEPLLDEIATEMGDKVEIVKLNIDENPETAHGLPGHVGADADHLQGRPAGPVGRRRQAQGRPGPLHRVGASDPCDHLRRAPTLRAPGPRGSCPCGRTVDHGRGPPWSTTGDGASARLRFERPCRPARPR